MAKSKFSGICGLIFLDLETTGLDPQHDLILEVYAEVQPVGAYTFAPKELIDCSVACSKKDFDSRVDDYVRRMHTENGLAELCFRAHEHGYNSLATVERTILAALPRVNSGDLFMLCGNSVHFDLSFIRLHMPGLAAMLSHRVLDVTTLQLFAEMLGKPAPNTGEAVHRARADVNGSKAELGRIVDLFA